MAGATTKNLQQAALGGIAVLVSKDAHGNPFRHGHLRLTEIAVEEYFGRLRVQSPSAQLTARSYWAASAKTMLSDKRSSEKRTSPECTDVLRPITPEQFQLASERALAASLKLVSFTSGFAVGSLEEMYRQWCDGQKWKDTDLEPEDLDGGDSGGEAEESEMASFLNTLVEESHMQQEDMDDDKVDKVDEVDGLEGELDKDMLKDLFLPKGPEKEISLPEGTAAIMPKTLHEALNLLTMDPGEVEVFDRIWRLLMGLRYWNDGGDLHWVRNPHYCRTKSAAGLNWYQWLVGKKFYYRLLRYGVFMNFHEF